ncbi:MAG: glycosyltransferase family 4 protein [Phycisphaerales bacterium]|nr:MAG: glycosyltransferase family 4 protein [Phycisphaerales bacterium]
MAPPTILIISQVYVPDPASVGQHIADAAEELARRGYRVVVYASANGYDDPTRKYPRREALRGVDVRRLPFSSFGKGSITVRLLAQSIFVVLAFVRGLFTRNLASILVSTSPPFCGVVGAWLSKIRRVPVTYWLMDLNPDQMLALGKARPDQVSVRVFELFNRIILRQASNIVMMDRFMLDRVQKKGVDVASKTTIAPPWPHDEGTRSIAHSVNPFRSTHNLEGKFVVMYSGNHSPANPLTTLLDAAERLRDDPRLVFLFIGGGGGKKEVDERIASDHNASNLRSLPYQPLDQIQYSLSAADVHVVSIGNEVVGIVHPCKVYGAMAVSRPVLLLGPSPSHVSDLIATHSIGWHVAHGDVDGAVRTLQTMLEMSADQLHAMGDRAARVVSTDLGRDKLCGEFCDVITHDLAPAPASSSD